MIELARLNRVLVLAPHTDDGELGCGGAIARHVREGAEVHYVAFSSCAESLPEGWPVDTLRQEVAAATASLGIASENLQVFNFKVRWFPQQRQEILEEMIKLRTKFEPDIVYLPASDDVHQDHNIVFIEGLRAFKRATLLGYELPWNSMHFRASAFVILSPEDVSHKVAALQQYRSQAHRSYMSEEFIRSGTRVRGEMAGSENAEAFELIRLYIR